MVKVLKVVFFKVYEISKSKKEIQNFKNEKK